MGGDRGVIVPADGRPLGWEGWAGVVPAVLAELREQRAALHRAAGARCDVHVDDGPGGPRVDGECVCRDLVVDMLVEAHRWLAGHTGTLRNPPGAVRAHLRTRATGDWIRRRRIEVGAQARCDRIRSGARAAGLPDEFHRAVLEYLVDEAGSPAPLDGSTALVRRLAVRAAAEFGGRAEDQLAPVAAAVAAVECHCRRGPRVNAGTADEPEYVSWWERYVDRPLGRRPCRAASPLPDPMAEVATTTAPDDADACDTVVLDGLVEAARRHPGEPVAALREALPDLADRGLVPRRTVEELLVSDPRMARAARELSALA